MDIYEKVKETAMQSGMWQTGYINTQDLLFYSEIRKICKENSCRNYGTTWACSVDIFDEKLKLFLSDYLLLSNEGCGRCKKCTYPDSLCRFPEHLHHSIEGYGFQIYELAKAAGIKYNNGENTVTFFGGLLFRK